MFVGIRKFKTEKEYGQMKWFLEKFDKAFESFERFVEKWAIRYF